MKTNTLKTLIVTITIALTQAAQAATSIEDTSIDTLACEEVETGSELQLKVETTYTTFNFDGSSISEATKRTIEIVLNGQRAVSTMQVPRPSPSVRWQEIDKIKFLGNTDKYKDGSHYIYDSVFYDKESNQYPAQLLRLKAMVPRSNRKIDGGFAPSHYSINLILPESRMQKDGFIADGYVDYYLDENPTAKFTVGLARMKCTNGRKSLSPDPCLSKKDAAEIRVIEDKIAVAKAHDPGCETAWGAAACISPFEAAVLRVHKSKTKACVKP